MGFEVVPLRVIIRLSPEGGSPSGKQFPVGSFFYAKATTNKFDTTKFFRRFVSSPFYLLILFFGIITVLVFMSGKHVRIQKQEAQKIIDELDIMAVIENVRDTRVVGSVALDVIVKPDIDIHIVVEDLFNAIDKIYRHLISNDNIHEVKIKDFGVAGILVGVDEYKTENRTWSIDFWVTTDEATTGFADVKKLLQDMSEEHRRIIIQIKNEYYSKLGGTSNGLSPKIYKAVVYDGVKDIESFRRWLN